MVAELLERVLAECSRAHAVRQRVPFTVGQARDAILQITECRFLARDEGDTEPEGPAGDSGWREDEEPEPCVADSWAQGFVPVLRLCRDEPLSPLPRPLGSLLDPARLVPGVTVQRAGSLRRGRGIPGEEEEEEEAKRDLRPIRPPGPFPATAARQLPGDAQC
ncbi:hypothetical protein Q9233_017008 [Columba guinea]|nr:hypothetical protein Q9233_017008 [Columba guinea]